MTKTYQCKYIKCGKSSCRSCPHGPYWYVYWKEGGKTKCKYVGKDNPFVNDVMNGRKVDKDDLIFDRRTASKELAWQIMGCEPTNSGSVAKKHYLAESKKRHPDSGGDHKSFTRLNAAWTYLKSLYGWK